MIIHLTGSSRQMGEDYPYLQKISGIVHDRGITLARNWMDAARARTSKGIDGEIVDWEYIVEQDLESMARADAVIIEGTNYSFSQGFQAAKALEFQKPTLFITRNMSLNSRYISGIVHPSLTVAHYSNLDSLKRIIETFLTNLK